MQHCNLAGCGLPRLAVAIFVWWFRGYLVERIATNEQRLALARDLLVKTGDGPPISPVMPCNAPATDAIQSVEPPKLR